MTAMPTHRIDAKHRARWHAIGSAAATAAVITVVAGLALGLAAYSAAASYESVSRLAARLDVPLASLNPIGIDGGLLGVIVLDIALTWVRRPIPWLRFAGRLFAIGTVAANAAAGWPDPGGVGLRIAAPVLFIVIVEAARHVLLHRDDAPAIDRIPRIRWLLDFRGTFALWKRMRLWGERSYKRAVEMELDRITAIEKLTMKYAPDEWTAKAPADLVWMLRAGVRMTEALERVAELTEPEPVTGGGGGGSGPRKPKRPKAGGATGNGTRERHLTADPEEATADEAPADLDSEARVLWFLDKGYSASRAGVMAGLTDSRGRQIARLRKPAPKGIDEGGAQ